jgi:hypothetical protein
MISKLAGCVNSPTSRVPVAMIAFLGPSQGADSFWKRNQNLARLRAYVRLIAACYDGHDSGPPHRSEKCARDAAFLGPRAIEGVCKKYNFVLVIIWMPRV